jgi:hypothetical protein
MEMGGGGGSRMRLALRGRACSTTTLDIRTARTILSRKTAVEKINVGQAHAPFCHYVSASILTNVPIFK